MEFETVEDRAGGEYLTALSGCMPDGIRLLSYTKLKEEGKTSLAAAVAYASYVVKFRGDGEERQVLSRRLKEYISQESILCEKMNKKKKIVESRYSSADPVFFRGKGGRGANIPHSMTLKTGSGGNLNPEMLVKSFCEFCGVEYLRHRWDYRRTEMYFISGEREEIQPLTEFSG